MSVLSALVCIVAFAAGITIPIMMAFRKEADMGAETHTVEINAMDAESCADLLRKNHFDDGETAE